MSHLLGFETTDELPQSVSCYLKSPGKGILCTDFSLSKALTTWSSGKGSFCRSGVLYTHFPIAHVPANGRTSQWMEEYLVLIFKKLVLPALEEKICIWGTLISYVCGCLELFLALHTGPSLQPCQSITKDVLLVNCSIQDLVVSAVSDLLSEPAFVSCRP